MRFLHFHLWRKFLLYSFLKLFKNQFIRNIGWLGLSEFGARITRLITTIILARWLVPNDFGLAALALTSHELIKILGETGAGQAIIRAKKDELAQTCNTAYILNWICCIFLFLLHIFVGFILSIIFKIPLLIYLMVILSFVFLIMPFGLIHVFLIKRKNNLGRIALISGTQIGIDNILTALLAIFGLGVWAIILPKLLTAPIWLFGVRFKVFWRFNIKLGLKDWRELIAYGLPLLGSEVLMASRLHLDKLIVGGMLGVETLGIYYFAFNAGLGFSLSLTKAFSNALYPHLCLAWREGKGIGKALIHSLKTGGIIIVGLLILQAVFVPVYAPLIFGKKWIFAIPLMMLLCLTATPRLLGDITNQVLRVTGRTDIDFIASVLISFSVLSSLFLGIWLNGLMTGIIALLIISCLVFPLYMMSGFILVKKMEASVKGRIHE